MAAKKKKTPAKKAPAQKAPAKRKAATTKTPQKTSVLGFIFKWGFVAALWLGLFILAICAWYAAELPSITENADFERKASIIVKAADGEIIARYGDIVGERITVETVPEHLVQAVLATEDRRFYYHFGLDPLGLARAMFVNAQKQRFAQGGSTITQQLAKNLFLSRERTMKRKIQEAMLAFWLEYELTKDEILSAYLNRVYLGSGTFGVDAASKLYFKKPVADITVREAATLAGLLKAPSRYSPLNSQSLSKQRTEVVLNAMVDAGYLDESGKSKITASMVKPLRKPSGSGERYYGDWIVDQVNDLIGRPEDDLIIETTMNRKIQKNAEEALAGTIRKHGAEKKFTQGSVVVMRPNGAVVAVVGGKDYSKSQFNRATQAARQPGSSFKPFVYLTALAKGWQPHDLVIDQPIRRGRYRPKNFANKYYGEIDLTTAITFSLNTIAYKLIKDVGPGAVIDTARSLGIESELNADLSLGLGTNLLSPMEITGAYASIANGGVMVKPYGITKITSKDGTLYYTREKPKKTRRAIDPSAVGKLIKMMESVVQNGTGRGANFGARASGKTGTSQDSRDAWFIGFTDRLVTSVWLGNDDNTPMDRVTGGSFPARIWRDVMSKSNGQYAPFRYEMPFFASFQSLLSRWGDFGSDNDVGEDGNNGFATYRINKSENKAPSKTPDSGRYNE